MPEAKNVVKSDQPEQKPRKKVSFNFGLSKETAPKWIPFIVYLTFWAVLYIANRHGAEKTELQITQLQKELKEYRAEYLTIKAELMFKSKQSEVAKLVRPLGLNELTEPPKKLVIEDNEH